MSCDAAKIRRKKFCFSFDTELITSDFRVLSESYARAYLAYVQSLSTRLRFMRENVEDHQGDCICISLNVYERKKKVQLKRRHIRLNTV